MSWCPALSTTRWTFYDRFGDVVLLSVPLGVAIARVGSRTDNPYGRTEAERNEIAQNTQEIEPLLRESATLELDGRLRVSRPRRG